MIHGLHPGVESLHAHFSPERAPALTVESGDIVRASTIDVSWGMEPPTSMTAPRKKFEPRDASGPAMLGPIAVRGAQPGDVLEVQIVACEPQAWGWTYGGAGFGDAAFNAALGLGEGKALLRWTIDHASGTATDQLGHRVKVRPFLGIVGVSPGEPGLHSGWTPGAWGGNMDCRELVAGTSLFLPVLAAGAMLSFGDGHAAQGDGEVSGTAIECAMRRVEVRLVVRRDLKIAGPRARTPEAWVTMGFGETLDVAAVGAMGSMLDVMTELYALDRAHALALASATVSLRVTQVVNGVRGVHAMLPDDAIERAG